jgi:hypothetical protein
MKGILLGTVSLLMATSSVVKTELCEFAPKNERYIPAASKEGEATGISFEEFNSILDRITKIYGPIIAAKGGTLDIQRLWDDGTVNASAERLGDTYRLNMYGGLARHELITPDGFMLVACHEMGHHLGGKPKFSSWWPIGSETWASVEGQADYFGTAKCMHRMFLDMTNEELAHFAGTNTFAAEKCNSVYEDGTDRTICLRSAEAGLVLGDVLGSLGGTGATSLETPSTEIATGIFQNHPKAQCRTDTYFQGSLCDVPYTVDFSDTNQATGACNKDKYTVGVRPKCWFNPAKRQSRNLDLAIEALHQEKVYY